MVHQELQTVHKRCAFISVTEKLGRRIKANTSGNQSEQGNTLMTSVFRTDSLLLWQAVWLVAISLRGIFHSLWLGSQFCEAEVMKASWFSTASSASFFLHILIQWTRFPDRSCYHPILGDICLLTGMSILQLGDTSVIQLHTCGQLEATVLEAVTLHGKTWGSHFHPACS